MLDPEEYDGLEIEKEQAGDLAPSTGGKRGNLGSDDLIGRSVRTTEESSSGLGNIVWQYSMYAVAAVLFVFALAVWRFSLATLLSNQRVPPILDAPCLFTFLLLGVIFLALGFSVRELELEEAEERERERGGQEKQVQETEGKSSPGQPPLPQTRPRLPIHDEIALKDLELEDGLEKRVFEKLLDEKET